MYLILSRFKFQCQQGFTDNVLNCRKVIQITYTRINTTVDSCVPPYKIRKGTPRKSWYQEIVETKKERDLQVCCGVKNKNRLLDLEGDFRCFKTERTYSMVLHILKGLSRLLARFHSIHLNLFILILHYRQCDGRCPSP